MALPIVDDPRRAVHICRQDEAVRPYLWIGLNPAEADAVEAWVRDRLWGQIAPPSETPSVDRGILLARVALEFAGADARKSVATLAAALALTAHGNCLDPDSVAELVMDTMGALALDDAPGDTVETVIEIEGAPV